MVTGVTAQSAESGDPPEEASGLKHALHPRTTAIPPEQRKVSVGAPGGPTHDPARSRRPRGAGLGHGLLLRGAARRIAADPGGGAFPFVFRARFSKEEDARKRDGATRAPGEEWASEGGRRERRPRPIAQL
ncbi:unnamed protein product, partial [Ixodes persulcatus]